MREDPWQLTIIPPRPNASIQWKGTDVCMDFHCPCGENSHIDAKFAYYVKCWNCEETYEMGWYILAKKVEGPDPDNCIAMDAERVEDKQIAAAIEGDPDAYKYTVSRGRWR